MGHNQSSPHSADYPKPTHFPRAFNDRLKEHAYEISHTETNQPTSMKRSSSFIDHVPSREKQIREDIMTSYNDSSDIRISSTTIKTKRPSTVKSQITSQDRRRSEDFDMGQMEENTEILKKNTNLSENITCVDSTMITNGALSKKKSKGLPKSSSFVLSSCQTSSDAYHSGLKQEYNGMGPHFLDRASQRIQGKQVDDEVDVIMKTEAGDPNFQSVELGNKDVYITEASLCRMESIGFGEGKFKENKNGDDEVRILETGGSRLSSPKNILTNRYSPELQIGYSHKKSSNKKEDRRYGNYARPMLIGSFDDEQIGSHLVKDSDIMSFSSSEPDHADDGVGHDENKDLSPEKTVRGIRNADRKDGAYQEVEFSFKPNSMSKGSRRYTTEDDVVVENRYQSIEKINKNIFIHDPDLDAENPLIKSLHFNSIEFTDLKPSVENVYHRISPCKSSANNVLQDINNTLYSQENNREQSITEKKMSAHNILCDSKDLHNHEITKDTSKDRAESPSMCYPGTYFQSKTTIGDDQKELNFAPVSNPSNLDIFSSVPHISEVVHNEKDIFVEEYSHSDEGTKENRPIQNNNQNILKLQQITNSDSKAQKEADPVKSPEIYTVGRILQNMKKGIKQQIQNQEGFPNGLMKAKHYYQAQGSVSDKGHSFSKEVSAGSSSFFRLMKDSDKGNKAVASRNTQVYTLREDYQSTSSIRRPNLRIEKLRPRLDNYTNDSQGSFQIDDSISRVKRRKSELNNSRVQRGVPVVSHNKTLTQETCCISTATSRNEVSMNSMKLTKQASKVEIAVECDQAPRNLHKGAKSVTSSRTSVERNTPLLKKQGKKVNKDYSSTRDSQSSGKETMYTLVLPVTSPKEIDTKRLMSGIIEQKRKALSQQGKLNKTASRILSEKDEYSQENRTAKTPTYNKKVWNERENSMVRSKSAANQKKGESKGYLNETLDLPEKPFPRVITDVQDEKTSGNSYNAKILKNLLRGQMERPQKKPAVSDKSDRDIKAKVLNKTAMGFKEKSGVKSPFLKKPFEAR